MWKYHFKAFYTGVPVICIPFNGDQHFNASVIVKQGVGFWVNHANLLKELNDALESINK